MLLTIGFTMRIEKEDEDKEELSKKIFLAPLEFLLIGCSFKREDQEEEEDSIRISWDFTIKMEQNKNEEKEESKYKLLGYF